MTPWPGVTTVLTSAQKSLAVWTCSGIYHGFFLNLFFCSTSSPFRPLTIVMLSGLTVPMLKLNVTHHQPTTTHVHHLPSNTTSLWTILLLVKKLSALQEFWRGNLFQAMLEFARIIPNSVNCAAHIDTVMKQLGWELKNSVCWFGWLWVVIILIKLESLLRNSDIMQSCCPGVHGPPLIASPDCNII